MNISLLTHSPARNRAGCQQRRAVLMALLFATEFVVCAPNESHAIPTWKAWAPIDTLKFDHAYMVPDRFEPLRNGRIELVASGYGGTGGRKAHGLVWSDTAWAPRWTLATDNYAIWPSITPLDRQLLVWKTTTPVDSAYHAFSYIVAADVVGDSVTPPDTVARVDAASWSYSGTSWGNRRWVATRYGQQIPMPPLRIYRSDAPHQWRQMWVSGVNAFHGVVAAALDSETVFIVTSDSDERMRWGILHDTTWTVMPGYPEVYGPQPPTIVRQPDGGLRLAWANTRDVVYTRVYANSAWGRQDTVRAVMPFAAQHVFYEAQVSRDGGAHPALAWSGYAITIDVADYIWVSFPTETGFGVGERLEGSWQGINPTLVVDDNEDVWVAWWRTYDGIYWTHSHTTATSSPPTVELRRQKPKLTWTLSESAPGTWWGVMRSAFGAPAECVARIRAGADTQMTWADSSAPVAVNLSYAIRRECRDVRYQVTTMPVASVSTVPVALRLGSPWPNPAHAGMQIELALPAAGLVRVELCDVAGRHVRTLAAGVLPAGVRTLQWSGEDDSGRLLPPGLYFVRAKALGVVAVRRVVLAR